MGFKAENADGIGKEGNDGLFVECFDCDLWKFLLGRKVWELHIRIETNYYFPLLAVDWQNTLIFASREAGHGGGGFPTVYEFMNQRLLFVLS